MDSLDLLLSQYSSSEDLKKLIKIFIEEIQELNNPINTLLNNRSIFTSIGIQLDKIGELLGEPRFGRDDDSYRNALLFRIFLNTAPATPETILRAAKFITNSTQTFYWDNYPASYQIFVNGLKIFEFGSATINDVLLGLNDTTNLSLENNDDFEIRTALSGGESLPLFLKSLSPAATGTINVSYSLGKNVFSFSGAQLITDLSLENDNLFALENNDTVGLTLFETRNSEFLTDTDGFGYIELNELLTTGEDNETYILEYNDNINVGLLNPNDLDIETDLTGLFAGGIKW